MGVKDAGFRSLAQRLIGKYRTVSDTLTRTAQGSGYDPVTGTVTASSSSAAIKRSPAFPFEEGRVDGSTVLATDLYCYVAAADTDAAGVSPVPSSGDLVTLGGYSVIGAKALESGDQVAAYELHLRAG